MIDEGFIPVEERTAMALESIAKSLIMIAHNNRESIANNLLGPMPKPPFHVTAVNMGQEETKQS